LVAVILVAPAQALDPSKSITQYAHTAWPQAAFGPSGRVNTLAQTNDGYLWLGSEAAGLFRFNGEHFDHWQAKPGQALPNGSVYALRAAKDGGLWVGTHDGLAFVNDGSLKIFTKHDGLGAGAVTAVYEDLNSVVWVGTYEYRAGGVSRIEHGRIQTFGPTEGPAAIGVQEIYRDHIGQLWIGSQRGLMLWGSGLVLAVPQNSSEEITSISEHPDGTLWLANGNDIISYSNQTITVQTPRLDKGRVRPHRILVDRDGGIWVATRGQGLFHRRLGQWERMTHADGLSSDRVVALFEDREGNIWVGTENGADRFRDYSVTTYSTREGLPANDVANVVVDSGGSVCAGVPAVGLQCVQSGETYRLPAPAPTFATHLDRVGRLIVATERGVFMAGKREPLRAFSSLRGVYSITEDRDRNLWFGDIREGLFRMPAGKKTIGDPVGGFTGRPIVFLLGDRAGKLWIAHRQGGLSLYQDGAFRSFSAAEGLGSGFVSSIFEDHSGTVWAGTESGLSRYGDSRFVTITTRNGLPCNAIHDIVEDDLHYLWLTTSCGLMRVQLDGLNAAVTNPANTVVYELFGPSDGFRATSLRGSTPRSAKSPDGKLWFATNEGLAVVNPHRIPRNIVPPPVHIEQVTVDGKAVDAHRTIKLPPTVTRLEFDYTALSFTDPERVLFRYQLEGFESSLVDVGTRRQAFYTNLRPGSYRFHVIACNNDGLWNKTGDTFSFEVESVFLQTRLFAWLCAAGGVFFIWAVFYLRTHDALGVPLKKLFRAYPVGIPGAGLMLFRLAIGFYLITQVLFFSPFADHGGSLGVGLARGLEVCGGVLLAVGLMTPIVGGLLTAVVLVEMVQRAASDPAYASLSGSWQFTVLYLVMLGALTLVGPGGYSLDARIFGKQTKLVSGYSFKS
jgi:ligand-binding sensor domain-containing protein/uncharacterized membrane protein YphA (DoxX/SURF4 family)